MEHVLTPEELKSRTKQFALRVIGFVRSLPADETARIIGRQLIRSGTSVGANYRAACRAKSKADMISKLKTVEEEIDETGYWFELLEEAGYRHEDLPLLMQESNELLAIVVASIKTLRFGGPQNLN